MLDEDIGTDHECLNKCCSNLMETHPREKASAKNTRSSQLTTFVTAYLLVKIVGPFVSDAASDKYERVMPQSAM